MKNKEAIVKDFMAQYKEVMERMGCVCCCHEAAKHKCSDFKGCSHCGKKEGVGQKRE